MKSKRKLLTLSLLTTTIALSTLSPITTFADENNNHTISPFTSHANGELVNAPRGKYEQSIHTSKSEPYYKMYFRNDSQEKVTFELFLGNKLIRSVDIAPGRPHDLKGDFRATNKFFNGQTYLVRVRTQNGGPLKGILGFRTEATVIK